MDWKTRALSRLALCSALLMSACHDSSGGGGGGGNPTSTPLITIGVPEVTGRILLTDATADGLAGFSALVQGVRLELSNGAVTKNYLREPLRVEFFGLEDQPLWLVNAPYPANQLVAIHVEFQRNAYQARALDSTVVSVNALSDTLRAELLCPPTGSPFGPGGSNPLPDRFSVDPGELTTFMVDLDMLASLRGDPALGTVEFDPSGTTLSVANDDMLTIEEVDGLHRVSDEMEMEIELDGYPDDERESSLGMLPVEIGVDTLLLDVDGTVLAPQSFFGSLRTGLTISEVHGSLPARGVLQASRVEIEDQDKGLGDTFPVKIEGRIYRKLDLPSPQIDIGIQEIEKGVDVALPVLAGLGSLGDPATISVLLTDPDLLLMEGNQLVALDDLVVGQRVKVKFEVFSTYPFVAARINVLEPDARFAGVLESVNGLPTSFTQRIDTAEPAVVSGQVQSSTTDVTVDVSGAEIVLDTLLRPTLSPDVLVNGTTVRVNGVLSGPPDAPTILARHVRVKCGLLAGAEVTSITSPLGISVDGGEMLGSFGNDVTPGGVQWLFFEPDSHFFGAAKSRQDLFDLFDSLAGSGLRLMIDVKGIGLGGVMEINAFEIHSRIVP